MADRYTYIPLIGVFIIAAWGAAEFAADSPPRNKALAAAVVLSLFAWLASGQVATWSSSESLFRNAAETQPHNLYALRGLGMVYWQEGRLAEAQQQFEAILDVQPDLEIAQRELALLLAVRDDPAAALKHLDAAIKARPQQPEPWRHKAWILATFTFSKGTGRDNVRDGRKAVETAGRALELSPSKGPEYWDTLAAALAEAHDFKGAVAAEEEARNRARLGGAADLLPGIEQRLESFQAGMPYHAKAERPQRD